MKNLLLLLLFVPLSIWGQKDVSQINIDSLLLFMQGQSHDDDHLKTIQSFAFYGQVSIKIDTIPCAMLISECDGCNTKQVTGYRVVKTEIKSKGQYGDSYYLDDSTFKTHLKYLSINYTELKPNITVWLSQ